MERLIFSMKNECIFCKISKNEIKAEFIYENDNFFSIKDISPQIKGHSLIISKKHFKTILDMPNSLTSELIDCIKNTSFKVLKETDSDGFNLLNNNFKSAGQVINHIHFHLLPRKTGDNLSLEFKNINESS